MRTSLGQLGELFMCCGQDKFWVNWENCSCDVVRTSLGRLRELFMCCGEDEFRSTARLVYVMWSG